VVTLAIAALALIAAAAFAVWQLVERPSVGTVSPAPGSAVPDARPTVSFRVPSGARLGGLSVRMDGRDVTDAVRASGRTLTVPVGRKLRDGTHRVSVRFSTSNVFARHVSRDWSFDVDTAPPALTVAGPGAGAVMARHAVRFRGTAEAGSTVAIAHPDGSARVVAGPSGAWAAVVRLPEGPVRATITARDRAGNATERTRRLRVDTTAPRLVVATPAPGARITDTDAPLVQGTVASDDPRDLTWTVAVNGRTISRADGADAASADEDAAYYGEVAATTPVFTIDGHRFSLPVGTLPQGRNRIVVSARDRAGNRARATVVVLVDSTEQFGSSSLVSGARGADVLTLQQRLREARAYPKRLRFTSRFDPATRRAVTRYQRAHDLPATGVVDARTRQAMIGRLVVTLSQRKLRLIRDGRVVRTYSIAVGMPGHETPTGDYAINDKQVDPAWYPPDSPWAAELATIPPGPGNPLGTRWIGTTAPAIGIHGTYADSSVGTAASHGCMRMHIPDVEALYDEVVLGMKVSIRA
jgi:lipoprotein-anchoring transpeptidase ErfK/SrfK